MSFFRFECLGDGLHGGVCKAGGINAEGVEQGVGCGVVGEAQSIAPGGDEQHGF